ncbi:unnamed protein product [Nippostrongylus brasiliensis]|uniref:Sodium/potassium/calcium exchanger 6, mitochondrial (inferred by orthology to a human protein) n=1 Tax=Nippostrongylus brasiliensis TaxID=27835 RepID=A0A0N4XHT7_NIPBR|nr:unnamed protein product [Nippostrongylus brasiliensis]
MTQQEICDYINYNDDICEGGGYLLWSQYVECQFNTGKKGVTFMAFGNGAPDIFGSIASVLSSPKPKAGLALGELFGAGTFVTTVVTATIILVKPFKIDIFSTLRDILFYLVAIGWILFVFLHSDQVYIWEPAGIFPVIPEVHIISDAVEKIQGWVKLELP